MKLSFSLPAKSSSKPKLVAATASTTRTSDDDQCKDYVTEFDATKTLTPSKRRHVIPPQQNEWRPYKKMKNLDLPLQSDGSHSLQFEVESTAADADDQKMSYGLNLRQSTNGAAISNGDGRNERPQSDPVDKVMLQSLKDDLKRLPEDRGFEEFEEVPVEGFGAALLAGYGWYEGRGIGKNAKEDVKVKQYEKRTAKEGLGFHMEKVPSHDSRKKEEEKGKTDKEKAVDNGNGFLIGKHVRVIAGRYMGSKGRILEKIGADWLVLKLSKEEEEVRVSAADVADLGSKEEEKCLKKLKELKIREEMELNAKEKARQVSKRSRESEKRGGGEVKNHQEHERSAREHMKAAREHVPWLRNHIRVRIISKDLKGGRLYLKKGEVVDVVTPTKCDISMDESRELIQGVDQELLETALPRRGGPVLILYGRHKGVYGSLVERDLDRETGVVRDADSHELFKVQLEQIAEYIGDPSYVGY